MARKRTVRTNFGFAARAAVAESGLDPAPLRSSDCVMPAPSAKPVSTTEAKMLFADLRAASALVLAVSGGPDSTALMVLAARWRKSLQDGPKLIAVTVDHGLRAQAKAEAAAVAALARKLGLAHRTLRWAGEKPKTGLQQAARQARYRLLAAAARKAGAGAVLTAHTRDDQAETVLIRMCRGSGIAGLGAMARWTVIPGRSRSERARNPESTVRPCPTALDSGPAPSSRPGMTALVRPFLDIPKARLVATLRAAKISFADDPSNRDPRFTRARLRAVMPEMAKEGLDPARLALLARRIGRANAAIEASVDRASAELAVKSAAPGTFAYDAAGFARLPAEIGLRLLGRAVGMVGSEGPVELAKLEALMQALEVAQASHARFRRSLAGAVVTLHGSQLVVERAPPRRGKRLTTGRRGKATRAKTR